MSFGKRRRYKQQWFYLRDLKKIRLREWGVIIFLSLALASLTLAILGGIYSLFN